MFNIARTNIIYYFCSIKQNINVMKSINKSEVVLDTNNPYVQTLIKIFNEFMLEEASGQIYTELRLKNKIEQARNLFADEKRKIIEQNKFTLPIFGRITTSKYRIILKNTCK